MHVCVPAYVFAYMLESVHVHMIIQRTCKYTYAFLCLQQCMHKCCVPALLDGSAAAGARLGHVLEVCHQQLSRRNVVPRPSGVPIMCATDVRDKGAPLVCASGADL